MLTVLILAAGYGRRMGPFSRMINKGLVPYDNQPLIGHIMCSFDNDTKFVIACGHMGQQVKDYVNAVHSERNVTFVDIENYSELSTGPATTIRICYEYINGPFLWISCDTLFDFDFSSKMDENWIGVHPVDSKIASDYCWVTRDGDKIVQVHNKKSSNHAVDAFIGVMYCKDSTFVDNLKRTNATDISSGLLTNLNLKAHTVKLWNDFGTYDKWLELSRNLPEVSFPKPDELFYQDNSRIIKFTVDKRLAEKKYYRAKLNPKCMPQGIKLSGQFLVYDFEQGDIFYNVLTPERFESLLSWAEKRLWIKKDFDNSKEICRKFYQEKTQSRLSDFRFKYNTWDEPSSIVKKDTRTSTLDFTTHNVKNMNEYLSMIDWDWLCDTDQWCYNHGDFQFENVIYNKKNRKFTCIDWRTDFGGETHGDLYYDLAKMAGGILLNYQSVKLGHLKYFETDKATWITDCSISNADLYMSILKTWCDSRNLDFRKVEILIPLIYLNMSPLHEAPFDKYLYSLSLYYFSRFFR